MFLTLFKKLGLVFGLSLFLLSCAAEHEYRAQPIRNADSYANRVGLDGAIVAAEAIYDSKALEERFGYDLKKAGVIPVALIVENHGSEPIAILPKPYLNDANGDEWDLLPRNIVVRRISDYTSGITAKEGVGRTAKGAILGAVLGAAIGVATGTNVGEAAGKGAAVGGAVGVTSAVLGGGKDSTPEVAQDYDDLAFDHFVVAPGERVHGLLYFPGEASRPTRLTLEVKPGEDNKTKTLALPL